MATVGCDLVVHQGMCRCLVKWEMGTAFEGVGVEPEPVEPLGDRATCRDSPATRTRKRQVPLIKIERIGRPCGDQGRPDRLHDERPRSIASLPNPDRCPSAPTMATSTSW